MPAVLHRYHPQYEVWCLCICDCCSSCQRVFAKIHSARRPLRLRLALHLLLPMSQWPFSIVSLYNFNCKSTSRLFHQGEGLLRWSRYCETLLSPVVSSSGCISSPYWRAAMQCTGLVTADAGCCTLLTHCHILTSLQLHFNYNGASVTIDFWALSKDGIRVFKLNLG